MVNLVLCNIPFFNNDYTHVMDFENRTQQINFMEKNLVIRIDGNIQYDNTIPYIILNTHINNISNADYLYYKDDNNKYHFFFINSKEFKTKSSCKITLECDVFQTYMFDYEILPSHVDRCHVNRWNGDIPTDENIDEGLNIGEYEVKEIEQLYSLKNNYIMCATSPLGWLIEGGYIPKEEGGGGNTEGGNFKEGIPSSGGFRFIKGFEGFAPVPYQDSSGYWTIAYGVTAHGEPTIYNTLSQQAPLSEETGARVSFNLKVENYGKPIVTACEKLGVTKQCQFDALLSLAYNCGIGVVTGTNSLMTAIKEDINNESRIRSLWESFYVTSDGTLLEGLVARRKEECNMFFGKPYEVRSIPTIGANGQINGTVTENNGNGWLP